MMEMEWVNGFDLSRLLTREMLDRAQRRVNAKRWKYINEVIVTAGPTQPRMKPGVAIAIVRECLAALAALHREGIVHGDMKPSNIMIKRTGNAKIVDIGSAFEMGNPPARRTCTPTYAAPEVLEGGDSTPRSDLASLGYVLIEMLSGVPAFTGLTSFRELRGGEAKLGPAAAEPLAGGGRLQRVVDGLLPRADCPRPDAAIPQRRGGRPGQRRRRQLPSPTDQERSGQRVRQRDPRLAGELGDPE